MYNCNKQIFASKMLTTYTHTYVCVCVYVCVCACVMCSINLYGLWSCCSLRAITYTPNSYVTHFHVFANKTKQLSAEESC